LAVGTNFEDGGADNAITEGDTSDDRATITVTLVNIPPFTNTVDVEYTFEITHSADISDEILTTPSLPLNGRGTLSISSISAGTGSVSVTVDALLDNDQDDEIITFTVTGVHFRGSDTLPLTGLQERAIIRVIDAGAPTRILSFTTVHNGMEGLFLNQSSEAASVAARFRIVLDRPPTQFIRLRTRISGSNVTSDDFQDVSNINQYFLSFAWTNCDGTSCTVALGIRNDDVVEGTETVNVEILDARHGRFPRGNTMLQIPANPRTTFTITDND